jgi:hypothetical protein
LKEPVTGPEAGEKGVGLLGGIADPIFSSLLAPGNDAFNEALQVLRNRNLAGRFWSL